MHITYICWLLDFLYAKFKLLNNTEWKYLFDSLFIAWFGLPLQTWTILNENIDKNPKHNTNSSKLSTSIQQEVHGDKITNQISTKQQQSLDQQINCIKTAFLLITNQISIKSFKTTFSTSKSITNKSAFLQIRIKTAWSF